MNRDVRTILDVVFVTLTVYEAYKYLMKVRRDRHRLLRPHKKNIIVRDPPLEREVARFYAASFNKLRIHDPEQFCVATRMQPKTFDALLGLLKPKLERFTSTAPIPPDCRLFLTLCYLAHGNTRRSFSMTYKLSVSTLRKLSMETCEIIWRELSRFYMLELQHKEWSAIAEKFDTKYNLPNCVGVLECKPISVRFAKDNETKHTKTFLLLGACDTKYEFINIDIAMGLKTEDSEESDLPFDDFGKRLIKGELDLPRSSQLPNSEITFPYYFAGHSSFPLKTYLMRPYPGFMLDDERVHFNQRLREVRNIARNAFGILKDRWRILRSTLHMRPEQAVDIIKSTIYLHNFLINVDKQYCPPGYADRKVDGVIVAGKWRNEDEPSRLKMRPLSSDSSTRTSFALRDKLKEYLYENAPQIE